MIRLISYVKLLTRNAQISFMIAIIVSRLDPAGMNISKELLNSGFSDCGELFDNNKVYENKKKEMKLYFINSDQVFADYVDKIDCDLFVFASKHSSESKKPSLTVHPIGNWGLAELGGRDFELVMANASVMKNYLKLIKELKDKLCINYEVVYEATHHGPYVEKPAIYIEIGSGPEQWSDTKAAKIICETIISSDYKSKSKTVLGFGGLHYNPHFTRIALQTDFAFSHMCPKHALKVITKESVEKAINATLEDVEAFVVEKKGLSTEKKRILSILKEFGLEILKTDEIR
ncbi:MAG: D-aminoacyl-tRNA deacylase [Candidatus Diapherotrites archaeon]